MSGPRNRHGSRPRFGNNCHRHRQSKDRRAEPLTLPTKELEHVDAQVLQKTGEEDSQDPSCPEAEANLEQPRKTGCHPQLRQSKSRSETATAIYKQLLTTAATTTTARYSISTNESDHQWRELVLPSATRDKPRVKAGAACSAADCNCAPLNSREERRLFRRLLKVETLGGRRRKASRPRKRKLASRSEPDLEKVLSACSRRSFKKVTSHGGKSGVFRDHVKRRILINKVQTHRITDKGRADEAGQATSDTRSAGSRYIISSANVDGTTCTDASYACKTNQCGGQNTKLRASISKADLLGARKDGNNACNPESKSKLYCRSPGEHSENCKYRAGTASTSTDKTASHSTIQVSKEREKPTTFDCIFTFSDSRQSEPTDFDLIRSVSYASLDEHDRWEYPKSSMVVPPQVKMNLEIFSNPTSDKLSTKKKSERMSENGECHRESTCSAREKSEVESATGSAADANEYQGSKQHVCHPPSSEYVFVVDTDSESKRTVSVPVRANSEESGKIEQVKWEHPMPSMTSPRDTEMEPPESVNKTSPTASTGTCEASTDAELKNGRIKALASSFREAAQKCTMLRQDREAIQRKLEEAKFYLFEATNKVKEKRLELAQARREIQARDEQIRLLRAFQAEAQADIGSLRDKLSDLRRQLDAAETNCQSEIVRNHRNRAQIAQLEARLDVKSTELATVTSALAERCHTEEDLTKRLHQFQQQLTAAGSEEVRAKKQQQPHPQQQPSSDFERLEQRIVEMEARFDLLLQELRERNSKQQQCSRPLEVLNLHHRPDPHHQHYQQHQHQHQHRKDSILSCEANCFELLRGRLCQIVASSSRCLDSLDQRHELERYLLETEKLRRLIEKLLRDSGSTEAAATTTRADASVERSCNLPDP